MENEDLNTSQTPPLQQTDIKRSYSEWAQSLVKMMNQYPLVHNKWRSSRFKKMYNDGLSVVEAFRCWICAH